MRVSTEFRQSGIDIIGDFKWGTHISHLYSSKDEFTEVLVPYIKAGLENNELCIWIYSSNIRKYEIINILKRQIANIDSYLLDKQLIIKPHSEWYISNNCFDEERVKKQWLELIEYATDVGYDGLRAVGDTYWLGEYSKEFSTYERNISSLISKLPFVVICTYDISNVDIAVFEDVINNHNHNLFKYKNKLQLINNVSDFSNINNIQVKFLKSGEDLIKKDSLLFEILDSTTEGTYIIDFKKRRAIYSEQWLKRLGLSEVTSDMLLEKFRERMLPEDLEANLKKLEIAAINKEPRFKNEYRVRDKDNHTFWVQQKGKLIYNDNGEVSKGYGTFIDITDRIEYESKINLQNIILQSINHIYEKTIFSKSIEELGLVCLEIIETVTKSKFSFMAEIGDDGLLHDIVISDPGWDMCQMQNKTGHNRPLDNLKVNALNQSVLKQGKTLLTNDPSNHPDSIGLPVGHPELTAFLAVPFVHNGKVVGMVAAANRKDGYTYEEQELLELLTPTILEVILRKRAEIAESYNESLLRNIIEGSTDPIILKDKSGKVILANTATVATARKPIPEIIGKTDLEFQSDKENAKKVMAIDRLVMENDKSEVVEVLVPMEDGYRTYLATKTPWRDEEGNVVGIIGVERDITERKAMEDKLEKTISMLEKKNKLITEFFTNISHEFKTPLTLINLQLQIMESFLNDEQKLREYIDGAKQNTYRLTRLVNNLLDITKIEAGYLIANYYNTDIVVLISEICKSVEIYVKAKLIELCFESEIKSKVIPTDAEKIERIMLNLISNAIKYTEKNGKIIVKIKEKNDGGIIIEVKDTGIGIPKEKQNDIFDRFAQVNTSLSRKCEGCGIGLALVRSLVEMLKGSIKVRSVEGKGSIFIIELPLIENCTQKAVVIEGFDINKKVAVEFSDLDLDQTGF